MIPQPPFAGDLTLEQELEAFRALKPRLTEVWDALTAADDSHCTSVVVPSLTLDQGELSKLAGVAYYEERLLFLLIRLRNPRAHVVYVTSQPVHPMILDYYLNLLAGVPAAHARARLTMLCCHDGSPRPADAEDHRAAPPDAAHPRSDAGSEAGVSDGVQLHARSSASSRCCSASRSTGSTPTCSHYGTKSGSRQVFRQAGVPCPRWVRGHARRSRTSLRRWRSCGGRRPGMRRAIVKLNDSFSGEGNAVFTYPVDPPATWPERSRRSCLPTPATTRIGVLRRVQADGRSGGGVRGGGGETFTVGAAAHQPAGRGRCPSPPTIRSSAVRRARPTSVADSRPATTTGRRWRVWPIASARCWRRKAWSPASASTSWRSREQPGETWTLQALEINLRLLGTTHPFLALSFLTGGSLDPTTGQFISLGGRPKFYRATDNLRSERYRSLVPEDLIDIVTDHRLHYNHRTESGVLFHLIGAVSEFGKLGVTAIANTPAEADTLYERHARGARH